MHGNPQMHGNHLSLGRLHQWGKLQVITNEHKRAAAQQWAQAGRKGDLGCFVQDAHIEQSAAQNGRARHTEARHTNNWNVPYLQYHYGGGIIW
jgi:hypothetical protein